MKHFLIFPLLLFATLISGGQTTSQPPFLIYQNDQWVDSIFHSLTLDEKIGQLIMVAAYSGQGATERAKLLKFVKENKIGGIITMQGGPGRDARMVNALQASTKIPLVVAIDGEYGLGMRLDSTLKYPFAVTMGAMSNDSLIYRMGADIGRQCQRLGIHINFAPVADVNNNPANPVIGFRSFGDNPQLVAQKATWYSRGLQSQQILATAKHFPGHGDTESDSHHDLPVINHPREHLDSVELFPFRKLIDEGIGGMMTGHLNVPALDESGKAATASPKITNELLQHQMGFSGLVVSDAMNMAGLSNIVDPEVAALSSGVDLLEFVPNPAKTIAAIKKAVVSGVLSVEDINRKCRKVLMVKRWVGLNQYKPVDLRNLHADLNHSSYRLTIRNSYQNSLTLLGNANGIVPLKRIDTLKIAVVSIGRTSLTQFQRSLGQYTGMRHFYIGDNATSAAIDQVVAQLKNYNLVIASVNGLGILASQNFKITKAQTEAAGKIARTGKSLFVVFGNPYVIKSLPDIEKAVAVVAAYQENYDTQDLAAQLIFGAFAPEGRLPADISPVFKRGDGVTAATTGRFKFTIPEEVGVDSLSLKKKIDEIVRIGIDAKAFPGCEIFFAKNGKVFFHQCYGYHTYEKSREVAPDDLYDLASVTKILGPLPALMWLNEQKKFKVNESVSLSWPDWKGSNKQSITWADLLQHQARLKPGLSFWQKAVDANGQPDPNLFSQTPSEKYPLRVSNRLYEVGSYPDYIVSEIRSSPLTKSRRYLYSDLGFILFPKMIERMTGQSYETFLNEKFYQPLGASTLGYNPYLRFPLDQIVPTEQDNEFRRELLQGFVHDESAALMGGISGNAGLFGTITDVAKLMQMYLQYGQYGGERYIAERIVKDWTSRHSTQLGNRRGYGFDKPKIGNHLSPPETSYPAPLVSDTSFGHSGFTGTFVWADPSTGILFLFFTNRVHPTRANNALNRLKLRVQLQQALYESFKNSPGQLHP